MPVRHFRRLALAARRLALTLLYNLLVYAALRGGSVTSGYAPHYAPGVMEKVARNRDMPEAGCMVSSPVWPLGTEVWVYGHTTGALLRCTVTDVSHPRDRARHIKTRRVVELGYASTEALCGTTKGSVRECPVTVIKL